MKRQNHKQCNTKKPILIIVGRQKRKFGDYIEEILKAEGFNLCDSIEIGKVSMQILSLYAMVILGETSLTSEESCLLTEYLLNGGNILAFRPVEKIHSLFGIKKVTGKLDEGYIKINEAAAQLKGLTQETMQYHGTADLYEAEEAQALANIYIDAENASGHPAVLLKKAGEGCAVAVAYNMPKSIILTRQGNPKLAGIENDGIEGLRSGDLFVGWVDTTKNHLNQADEQMRIISRLLDYCTRNYAPLPRLWYFPDIKKSLVMVTDDGDYATRDAINGHLRDINYAGATMSVYLISPNIPQADIDRWIAQGNEISGHTDNTTNAKYVYYSSMNEQFAKTVEEHRKTFGLKMVTARNHWVLWCSEDEDGFPEFASQAIIEAKNRVELDCNYYHYDRGSPLGSFLGPPGNFTGSGLPMKFADSHGNVLNIYQSITQIPDEQWELGNMFNAFKTILDRSLNEEAFSFINANFHTQRWDRLKQEGMQILEYSHRNGIYTWASDKVVEFLRMKESARFHQILGHGSKLKFSLNVPVKGKGLTFLIPTKYYELELEEILLDGKPQELEKLIVKERTYAAVIVDGNADYGVEAIYR